MKAFGRSTVWALLLGAGVAWAAPPPAADFFRQPAISAPKLSPNGRYLAVKISTPDGSNRLAVLDLDQAGEAKVVGGFADADINSHHWLNDKRLVFDVNNAENGQSRPVHPGLWGVNRDGSEFRQLIAAGRKDMVTGTNIADRRLELNWRLHSVPDDGGDSVIVQRLRYLEEPESVGMTIARLDSRSGRLTPLSMGAPAYAQSWSVDRSGNPVVMTTQKDGVFTSYKRTEQGQWQQWQQAQAYGGSYETPFWFGGDIGLVAGRQQDLEVLYRVDMKTMKRDELPLVKLSGYDFGGEVVYDGEAKQLLGFRFESDAPGSYWLHPQLKAWQAKIDQLMAGTVNVIECGHCLSSSRLIVTSYSDQRPEVYSVFNTANGELKLLAASRPWIKPEQMGQRDYYRIKARDGLSIPVLVTLPAGKPKGPQPTVVLVHGGPYVRGTHWPWEGAAQFLASRGYLVLEPEFRGSTGYGWKQFRAGWKQWGLAMQDDVSDALKWAVDKGMVDAKRVCIAGSSYGGYATLMGLIKEPQQYQCGVSWAAVTDIKLLYSIHWSDLSDEWKNFGMPQLVGDPDKDAEQLRTTSPVLRAKEIQRPLLMAHGTDDLRVPIKHGREFQSALGKDQAFEYVVYPDEGHGWRMLKTQEDFWGRVERFLDQHIGSRAPASVKP